MERMAPNQQQQPLRRRIHKRKSTNVRPFLFIFCAFIMLYLGVKVLAAFSGGALQTTPARHVTVNDSFLANGWFFRDEVTISGSNSDTVQHLVYSGERVQKNAPLAIIYADEQSLDTSRSVSSLDKEISMLDTALLSAGDESDAAKLDQSIVSSLQQLATQLKSGAGAALDSVAESIRTQSLRRSAATSDPSVITYERDSLAAQRDNMSRILSGQSTQISAPSSGYFSEVVDGYENVLTFDELDGLLPERLTELTQMKEATGSTMVLGKVIQSFSWYLAAEVPVEEAERLMVGQNIRVGFTQASIEVPVSVYQINQKKDAKTAVILLEGNDFNTEIVSMRNQPIEVIIGTYTGLQVPKKAISFQDNELVVFILSGSVTKTKHINKLYEGDTFYIVEQSATDPDALVEQDMIIIRGKGLQNNMVVKTG